MERIRILLYVIITGLVINLLANMIWKYIPRTKNHIDKIVSFALIFVCILIVISYKDKWPPEKGTEPSTTSIFSRRDVHVSADNGGQNIFASRGATVNIGITLKEYEERLRRREQTLHEELTDTIEKKEEEKRREITNKLNLVRQKLSALRENFEKERHRREMAIEALEKLKKSLADKKSDVGEGQDSFEQIRNAFIIGDYENTIPLLMKIAKDYKSSIGIDSDEFRQSFRLFSMACMLTDKVPIIDGSGELSFILQESVKPSLGKDLIISESKKLRENIIQDNAQTWNKRGVLLGDKKRYSEADEAFNKAIELNPIYLHAWFNKGDTYYEIGKYSEALYAYDNAIKINPDNYKLWICKGNSLTELGRHNEAISAFEEAIRIKPSSYEPWSNKGGVLQRMGQNSDAISAFDEAIKLKPSEAIPWKNKGALLFKLGSYDDSAKCFEVVVKIDRLDWASLSMLGANYYNMRRCDEALNILDKSITLKPDDYYPYSVKATCLSSLGRKAEAVAEIEKALLWLGNEHPNKYKILDRKGLLLSKLGKLQEALKAFDKSIKLNNKYFKAWYNKGITLGKLGRYKEALDAFDQAVSLNPKDSNAKKNRQITLNLLQKSAKQSS